MKKKNIAIIQVRMKSSRLPGKMLKKIGKYSIIEWVIKRLKMVKSVDKIILATTKKKIDRKFKTISKKLGIDYFAGNEKDVLKRFVDAVKDIEKANIIRVCADNPFVDPGEINKLIVFHKKNKYDYVCNRQIYSKVYSGGLGAEIFSINLLRKLDKLVKDKNYREHVTLYLYLWKNRKKFNIHSLKSKNYLGDQIISNKVPGPGNYYEYTHSHYKFTLDTIDDFNFLKKIADKISINTSAKNILKIAKKLG